MTKEFESKEFDCIICDKHERNRFVEETAKKLYETKQCFTCNFWMEKLELSEEDAARRVIVCGVHYFIGEEPTVTEDNDYRRQVRSGMLGHGGRQFIINFNDGRIVKTVNLWCQGTIPERFRAQLPDNATFLDPHKDLEATEKAQPLKEMLEDIFGVSRDNAICFVCKTPVTMDSFRDESSRKEFSISRMCQSCQDSVFGPKRY